MGRFQDNSSPRQSASYRGPQPRICLRKGCGHEYQPRRSSQRYWQDADCLNLVRRWQAAKRQQQRRSRPEVRQQQAAAERERRARLREEARRVAASGTSPGVGAENQAADERPAVSGAWSRTRNNSAPFCDRPGCYEPLRDCVNGQSRYCDDDCRQAVRRVRDRERKWLFRKSRAGRLKRRLEYRRRTAARSVQQETAARRAGKDPPNDRQETVGDYRNLDVPRLACHDTKEADSDDRETRIDRGPRPPPSC